MQVHNEGTFEEQASLYYAVYSFKLLNFELSIRDCEEFIKELEITDEFEACSGIKRALDLHKEKYKLK